MIKPKGSKTIKKILVLLAVLLMPLSFCGESTEDAYKRGNDIGYEDGIVEVCYELKRISDHFYAELRSDNVCF